MLPVDSLIFQSLNMQTLACPVATLIESGVKSYPLLNLPDRMRTKE